jgi:hypothetical protein
MLDGYTLFLNKLEKLYPDLFFKMCGLSNPSQMGFINGFQNERIDLDDEERVRKYFGNAPILKEFTEIEFKIK